jgi:hypothetical protein
VRTYFWRLRWGRRSHADRCSKFHYIISDLRQFIEVVTNPKDSAAQTMVGPHNMIGVAMEDLPEAERRALKNELKEEAEARRRKLVFFQKTRTGATKKTIPAITTMATATPTVTPNVTPEELVKFMDIAVASKYGNDLTNFTCTITEVRSTLDTFKTNLQNMLPWQIRSVVQ